MGGVLKILLDITDIKSQTYFPEKKQSFFPELQDFRPSNAMSSVNLPNFKLSPVQLSF